MARSRLNEIAGQIVKIFKKDRSYFEKRDWSFHINKYNEGHLCFKDSWNYSVSNIVSKELTEDLYVNFQELEPFYDWLGERIELCLNLQKGKTNEDLKAELAERSKNAE